MKLNQKKCVPCQVGTPPLDKDRVDSLMKELEGGWKLIDGKRIEKTFTFKNFKEALHYLNQVGKTAEEEGHHPDMHLSWGKVRVELWTHKIGGLSESDFILASKADALYTIAHA